MFAADPASHRRVSVVVTSISAPNPVLRELANGCQTRGFRFYVIGDVPSPRDFSLEGCEFYSLERQASTGFRIASLLPTRHYARKNIGYLLAIQADSELLIEADDDNFPRAGFWLPRERKQRRRALSGAGWTNVYSYFTDAHIWPRGLPLDAIHRPVPEFAQLPEVDSDCPIQQGLVDENPDVDAVYRLVLPLPASFRGDRRVALGSGSWCPFNSQNTAWFPDAYPLLYLPSYCTFRMTDVWRSLVAQRIAWENGWSLLFTEPHVRQDRNEHNLMRDFADEVPGYLHNREIAEVLERLPLSCGTGSIAQNLLRCYEAIIRLGLIGATELSLLNAWLEDLSAPGL